jgi:hypothetical protein
MSQKLLPTTAYNKSSWESHTLLRLYKWLACRTILHADINSLSESTGRFQYRGRFNWKRMPKCQWPPIQVSDMRYKSWEVCCPAVGSMHMTATWKHTRQSFQHLVDWLCVLVMNCTLEADSALAIAASRTVVSTLLWAADTWTKQCQLSKITR